MTTLPDKPSELIRVALADLRKCEAMPDVYEIDMGEWYKVNGKCRVCLAGAVLAQKFDRPLLTEDGHASFTDLPDHIAVVMKALNDFRQGHVDDGLDRLGFEEFPDIYSEYADYDPNSPEEFHRTMERLAADLEAAGL